MKKIPKKLDQSIPEVRMKFEIAEEMGLMDKIEKYGWKSLTAKESGRIGGILANKKKKLKEEKKEENEK